MPDVVNTFSALRNNWYRVLFTFCLVVIFFVAMALAGLFRHHEVKIASGECECVCAPLQLPAAALAPNGVKSTCID